MGSNFGAPDGGVEIAAGLNPERYSVPDYGSQHAGRREVVDPRTPLTALLEGEEEDRATDCRSAGTAAARIVEQLLDGVSDVSELPWDVEELQEVVRDAIEGEIRHARLTTLRTMLRYLWEGGLNPWQALKKLLAVTRRVASHLIGAASQTEVAFLLGETKAATSAREKRQVEELMIRWGANGYHERGTKSDEAREVYRQLRLGNKSRSKGERRKRQRKKARTGSGE